MKILALDTTTRAGSIAVVVDDVVIVERGGDAARSHAERLPAELIAAADASGIPLNGFDVYAVASGPGSFTGLRIGIATMQGAAFVARRPMVGVSALDALAHSASVAPEAGPIVAAWMDAHRREVFAALYRVTDAAAFDPARLVELDAARVGDPSAILDGWREQLGGASVFIGDGAVLYADVILRAAVGARIADLPPLAGAIGRLASARVRRGEFVGPAGIQPLYVRRPDAELARESSQAR
jgi:tRNA threonylcarbamoyladenosine biosynthesis protein TsaB